MLGNALVALKMYKSLLEQKRKMWERVSMQTDLEFPPGIEFLQALHGLLSVHHRRHCGPLLGDKEDKEKREKEKNRGMFKKRGQKKSVNHVICVSL